SHLLKTTSPTRTYTLSLHDALPIYPSVPGHEIIGKVLSTGSKVSRFKTGEYVGVGCMVDSCQHCQPCHQGHEQYCEEFPTLTYKDRKSTRLNSSHVKISYAVFCLKK